MVTLTTQWLSILNIHGDDEDLRIQEYHSSSRREYHYFEVLHEIDDDSQSESESEDEDTDETDTEEED